MPARRAGIAAAGLVLLVVTAAGCGAMLSSSGGSIRSTALKTRSGGPGPLFTRLDPRECGLDFRNEARVDMDDALRDEGAGVAAGDIDGDGRTDVFLVSRDGPDGLFRNRGDMEFENITAKAGVAGGKARGSGAVFADVDGDGDLDLHVANEGAPNFLYLNDGRGRFQESAHEAGLAYRGASRMAAFSDYDRDGDLDCYLVTHASPVGRGRGGRSFHVLPGEEDRLYRNDGRGRFTDVSHRAGIGGRERGLAAAWWDADEDGWPDLFVGNASGNTLRWYHNRRDGIFTPSGIAPDAGVSGARGADFADLDGDARFDFAVAGTENLLLLNSGTEPFLDITGLAGVTETRESRSLKWGDFDSDGRIDLFVTHDGGDAAYRNAGDYAFEPAGMEWGLGYLAVGGGAAFADFDRDGDLDLVVNNVREQVSIYRNDGTAGRSIEFRLRGHTSNRWGIGARVTVESPTAGLQVRALSLGRGYLSSDEPIAHFGLGGDTVVSRAVVEWPTGARQEFENLSPGCLYVIEEGGLRENTAPAPAQRTRFTEFTAPAGIDFRHLEAPQLDDLSRVGPGLALGDIEGDGDIDLFVGGAAGQEGGLFINGGAARFTRAPGGAWSADLDREDTGCLWLDADGDDDLDLYVVSGGIESGPGSPLLQDRLYLNDGSGGFGPAHPGMVPIERESGGAAAAADMDRDGDLDIFVGGRVVPGNPFAVPRSLLLVKGRETFHDATDGRAPGLARVGRVIAATWSDADGDGWVDLLVTTESGPLRLFRNRGGKLVDATGVSGLAGFPGTWGGIAASDLDSDGDMDYAVAGGAIFRNMGGARFELVSLPRIVAAVSGPGMTAADLDGDGMPDLMPGIYLHHEENLRHAVELPGESGLPYIPGARGSAVGDLDGDRRPDLVVAVNDAAVRLFRNLPDSRGRFASIRLVGQRGNRDAIGARIRATTAAGHVMTTEISAGGGYLAQSSSVAWLGLRGNDHLREVEVRWPDGNTQRTRVASDSVVIDVRSAGGV